MSSKKAKAPIVNINKFIIFYLCFFIGLLSLTFFNVALYINDKPKEILAKANPEDSEILFWKSFLEVHPDYLQGWIELSKLELKSGNMVNFELALQEARKLDPNSEEIEELSKTLEN